MLEFIKPFRPIVWPSLQQEALGLSPSHVKAINRALIEAGLITMVHELTGLPAVVAFDSGNLMPVAKAIRAEDPDRQIVFMADNDHHLPRRSPPLPNAGLEKAHGAAREVRGVEHFEPHERATGTTLPPIEGGAQRPVR
jgi:phage/plasmid primase-like uncharacterized protein